MEEGEWKEKYKSWRYESKDMRGSLSVCIMGESEWKRQLDKDVGSQIKNERERKRERERVR